MADAAERYIKVRVAEKAPIRSTCVAPFMDCITVAASSSRLPCNVRVTSGSSNFPSVALPLLSPPKGGGGCAIRDSRIGFGCAQAPGRPRHAQTRRHLWRLDVLIAPRGAWDERVRSPRRHWAVQARGSVRWARARSQPQSPADDSEGAPLCRWRLGEVMVDVMAPAQDVLGFSSPWLAGLSHGRTDQP